MDGGLMYHLRFLCIFAYSDVQVSLRSVFRVVLFTMISAYTPCSVRVNLQVFVGQRMPYLRDVCLFAYSSFQHILVLFVLVILRLVCPILPISLDCPFLLPLRYSLSFI